MVEMGFLLTIFVINICSRKNAVARKDMLETAKYLLVPNCWRNYSGKILLKQKTIFLSY